ncbi:MAG: AraC family transcriptional regulator, partial [Pseudomonadota bacterium]
LRAKIRGSDAWSFDDGWRIAALSAETAAWDIRWSSVALSVYQSQTGQAPTKALRALFRSDLLRRWTIDDAACDLGLSPRSLQRALKQQGESYSNVLASVRATAAAHYLQSGHMSLSEVGYICGYADQAHFTRLFKAASAMTPGAYQRNFSTAASA